MRNNCSLPQILILSLLFFSLPLRFTAQHDDHKHEHGHEKKEDSEVVKYIKSLPKDADSLKGFDVKWVMERAVKRGITKEELPRYIELKKKKFIQIKYDLKEEQSSWNAKAPNPTPVPNAPCTNMGFETGDYSGWTLTSGMNSNSVTQAGCCPTGGGQATIMTGGTDACGGFPTVAPGGGGNSLMLGDGQTVGGYVNQISQTFQVTTTNQILTVMYAAVLQDGGHSAVDQPYFNMQVLDGNGNLLPCGNYNVIAGSGGTSGWVASGSCSTTSYLPWQTVSFDLSSIPVGGNVTVEFTCGDCVQTGHFGYAYIDAFCGTTQIQSSNPCSNGNQTLCAPAGMASYDWDGPAGSGISNVNSQCITVNTQGTYSCTTTQAGGCPIPVMTYSLGTSPSPIADFNSSQAACSQTVNFTDNTNLNGSAVSSWSWDFGDPSTTLDVSSVQNPTYTYANAGTYTATLTITSINGCTSTATHTITVTASPLAAFTAPADICDGTVTNFINTSSTPAGTTITGYEWDFTNDGTVDNTTASPSFTYPVGTNTVELIITNSGGCKDTLTQQIIVHAVPVPLFTTNAVCQGTGTTFTDNSTISTPGTISAWAWDFDNNGTTDNTTQSPTNIYAAAGTYTANLTVSGEAPTGCSASYSLQITVNPNPVSSFSATTVCLGNATAFTNLSTIAAPDNIASSTWNFGDGNASTTTNPNHTYASCGTFNAILTVITNNGCTSTFNSNITVNCNPVAAFTNTNVCLSANMPFTDNSTVTSSTISGWQWDFTSDGTTDDTNQNPGFVYPGDGTFNVELVVLAANGCSDTIVQPVTVFPNPQVSFTTLNACDQAAAQFNDLTSINAPDNISQYAWDFDNNGTIESALQNPTYVYPGGPNTYNVTLTATSNNGCVSSATIPVTVYPNPAAAFAATTECEGTATAFTDGSAVTGAGNTVAQWFWDYDNDGASDASVQNPSFTLPSSGAHSVELLVVTNNGCKDSILQTVNVNPIPVPNFSVTSVCFNQANAYSDLSSVDPFNTSSISSWSWDFDNNGSADNATQNPSNIFPSPGTMNTSLTVTTNHGCVATVTLPVVVYPLPVANFTSDPNCQNAPVQFTDLSSVIAPGTLNTWQWDLNGDGTTDNTAQNPSLSYSSAGIINVTLIVTTINGCKDTVIRPVVVNPNPVAAFSGDDLSGCPVHCVNFTDASTIASGNIINWQWTFGDGNTAAGQSQSHCYSNTDPLTPVSFTVELVVTSDSGCTSVLTLADYITVFPEPIADFTWGPASPEPTVTDPLVNFFDQSTGASAWSWDFGDYTNPNDVSTQQSPTYVYNNDVAYTYDAMLAIVNTYGCVDTIVKPIPVGPEFTFYCPNAFTPTGDNINDGFRGYGIGITIYNMWIYDRWGNMIFTTNDLTEVWDGKVQGKGNGIVQEDVYVWKVKLTDVFGRKHDYVGHVTVIK